MFCTKCGKEMPDDACFCANCGNKTLTHAQENVEFQQTEPSPHTVYPTPHIDFTYKYNKAILYDNERIMIAVIGFVYILAGVITAVRGAFSVDSLTSENFKVIYTLSLYAGIFLNLVFGIGIIREKRWAVLTVRVFMIIGAVFNVFEILSFLIQLNELMFGSVAYEIDYFAIIFLLISAAYNVAMIFFTSSIARMLSYDVQSYRWRILSKKTKHNVI